MTPLFKQALGGCGYKMGLLRVAPVLLMKTLCTLNTPEAAFRTHRCRWPLPTCLLTFIKRIITRNPRVCLVGESLIVL